MNTGKLLTLFLALSLTLVAAAAKGRSVSNGFVGINQTNIIDFQAEDNNSVIVINIEDKPSQVGFVEFEIVNIPDGISFLMPQNFTCSSLGTVMSTESLLTVTDNKAFVKFDTNLAEILDLSINGAGFAGVMSFLAFDSDQNSLEEELQVRFYTNLVTDNGLGSPVGCPDPPPQACYRADFLSCENNQIKIEPFLRTAVGCETRYNTEKVVNSNRACKRSDLRKLPSKPIKTGSFLPEIRIEPDTISRVKFIGLGNDFKGSFARLESNGMDPLLLSPVNKFNNRTQSFAKRIKKKRPLVFDIFSGPGVVPLADIFYLTIFDSIDQETPSEIIPVRIRASSNISLCPTVSLPVCGTVRYTVCHGQDGTCPQPGLILKSSLINFSNSCFAELAGAVNITDGPCPVVSTNE